MIRSVELLRPHGIMAALSAIFRRGINLGVIVDLGNRLYPSRTALVMEEQEISYRQLYRQTFHLADSLCKQYRLSKGKRVAIACRNHIEHVYTLFAAAATGADVYLIHPEMKQEAIGELLNRIRFDLFVYDQELAPSLEAFKENGRFLPVQGAVSIRSFLSEADTGKSMLRRSYSGKIVVLTSGSTGQAKTASRKASATAFISPFLALLKQLRLYQYESLYPATPFYHGFGLAALFVALVLGKRLYLMERFDAVKAGRMIDRYGIEVITVVPSMIGRLLEAPGIRLSSVRCLITGGAMLHPTLVEKTAERLQGHYIYNLYGTSEAGFCFMATPEALAYHSKTIGKPLNGVKVRISGAQGTGLPEEASGELWIKCSWSVQGNEWIQTGDLAIRDKEGYYFLLGRVDDLIISGGENIYPCELENILLKYPSVTEAAVVGVPDPGFGQRLRAYIVSNTPDENALREWLKTQCARHQLPRDIIFLPTMPYTPNGKIDKAALPV